MSGREPCADGLCGEGHREQPPGLRAGRRRGVIVPGGGDPEATLIEAVRAAPRRSSIIKDPSAQKAVGGRKKTVSFSSLASEKKVSSAADCLAFMQGGCELKKVRPGARVYSRFYTLDPELGCLRWEPSKKDPEKARLEVGSIREVRTGKSTDTFRHHGQADALTEEAAFSLIHGEDYQSLDLVALSPDVANIWVTGLRYLLAHPGLVGGGGAGGGCFGGGVGCAGRGADGREESPGSAQRAAWLAAEFRAVDEYGYGHVPEDIAVATVCCLCPGVREAKVRLRFKEMQRSKEKLTSRVTLEEFQEAFCELCTPPHVYFLLAQLSKEREVLSAQDLRLFLETEQGQAGLTAEACLDIIRRFEPSAPGRDAGLLGVDGFARYLLSPECHVFDPEHRRVCQDMSQPLQHYYISASHRSYLLEDQVRGAVDLGGLVRALRLGCRCLELSASDGPEGEPVLGGRHEQGRGGSHSSPGRDPGSPPAPAPPVALRSALEVINKYAFLASPFPLLLYLCQRCSPPQQRTLTQHLRRVFGARLFTPAESGGAGGALPSPEQLRGRVLLVGRRLPPDDPSSEGEVSDEDEEGGGGGMLAGRRLTLQGEEELGMVLVVPPPPAPQPLRLRQELSALVAIERQGSRSYYRQCRPGSPGVAPPDRWALCSLGEGEAGRLASEAPGELVGFTKRQLTRVRPGPVRLDSSNPNPQDYWRCGCQLVAMNLQSPGAMMDLQAARFAQNGGCGFVLRPALLRDEVSYFSANSQGCVPGVPPHTLRVRVISGHSFPKPPGGGAKGEVIDPYVVLELHGVPADCLEQRTRTIPHEDCPLIDETFEFQVNLPELALLRFLVLDDEHIGDDFIGQYSVAVECLQPGYRCVPLLSAAGEPLPHAALLVHVALSTQGGGGRASRRGLSVRRVRRGREFVTLRHTGLRPLDDAFRPAGAPLREAADLRDNTQSASVSFKELCGLPPVASLKQCIQSLAPRLQSPEGPSCASLVLREGYPCLEPGAGLSDSTRKLLTAYNTVIAEHKQLIENADAVQERIAQVQRDGMVFHEQLQSLGEKEGLKGHKLSKAVESFAWNITVLKGQCDLLHSAKTEALDSLRQLTLAFQACGLGPPPEPAPPGQHNSQQGDPHPTQHSVPHSAPYSTLHAAQRPGWSGPQGNGRV
ncbi:inactive phospholipase C-like protein 1 [Amia ocellicauda]|uniref:inactive phospholipase C-like protein 1 n=1 Tax=Amia ocellicauda TaxID=2972642 RepID=UPI003463B350